MKTQLKLTIFSLILSVICFPVQARKQQVTIVGSSTVFPFSTKTAEKIGRTPGIKTPIVESTGSGGGMKLFCSGIGSHTPDITNASRRIKLKELQRCQRNKVDVIEAMIGYDGIVLAHSKIQESINLSFLQIYLATAAKVPSQRCTAEDCRMIKNPYKKWSDIDPKLPNIKIEILGPPPTSGTRDAFQELAMVKGANHFPYLEALKTKDKKLWKKLTQTVRRDGYWVNSGENDNLLVKKLYVNPNAFGVFGFSFLEQNSDYIQGVPVNGIMPIFRNIVSGKYGISRSLFIYIKNAHLDWVPDIKKYLQELTSENAMSEDGYLVDKGLVPLPYKKRVSTRNKIRQRTLLTTKDLYK